MVFALHIACYKDLWGVCVWGGGDMKWHVSQAHQFGTLAHWTLFSQFQGVNSLQVTPAFHWCAAGMACSNGMCICTPQGHDVGRV